MTTQVDNFKSGDKVITSKGRFGHLESVTEKKAIVVIGKKKHEIYLTELISSSNAKAIDVEYYMDYVDRFVTPLKELVYIPSKVMIFDYYNPMDNTFLDICKLKLIKRINYKNVIITKVILT